MRGSGAPSRATRTRDTAGAVLAVLALGLALRLIIAYLLPGSGFDTDLSAFDFWGRELATNGPFGFYDRPFFHDYTPGYLYALWAVYWLVERVGLQNLGDTIPMFQAFGLKIVPILSDLAIGWLVHSMILELGGRRRVALLAAGLAVLNPISWFDSVVWGQVDSVGVVFMLLALRELWRDRPERAAIWTVVAAIIKPQLAILIPLVAVVTIRRALWPEGGGGDPARTGRPIRILTTAAAGFLTAVALCLPFGLSVIELVPQAPFLRSGLLNQVAVAAGGYPYLTVNAFNLWALVPSDVGTSLANAGFWVCDFSGAGSTGAQAARYCGLNGTASIGGIPPVLIGSVLLLATVGLVLWLVARRPDRETLLIGLAALALAFFVVPTRVHERYGYPFFAVGAILAAISLRWRAAYVALSLATLANMYVVLTTFYPDNPSIADWFGIGPALKSSTGVAIVAVVHTIAFIWVVVQLRRSAVERVAAVLAPAATFVDETATRKSEPFPGWIPSPPVPSAPVAEVVAEVAEAPRATPAPPTDAAPSAAITQLPPYLSPDARRQAASTASSAALPTWRRRATFAELGFLGWFRERLTAPPIRPDRSRLLAGEGGGRLDRLDLWLLVVLVVASLLLRTFRLAEPYQMHFDEVYHARTATEFLQDWRYGIEHDIYEWTHPHLAKYAMAAGLVLWGGDAVRATSELGVPVVGAVIEPRRASAGSPGGHTAERLHVATGSEIRTYDLGTRVLRSVVQAPGVTALAWDPTGTQLILGYGDGRLATLDATTLGVAGVDIGPAPVALATVDHPVERLIEADDGATVAAASSDRLSLIDLASASVVGSLDLPDIADLAPGGSGPALVANVTDVTDPAAVAAKLADLLGTSAEDYASKLADPLAGPTVILDTPGSGDTRKAVNAAIADGSLPGVSVDELGRIAVATSQGVAFIDTARASVITTVVLAGGAHGLAMVTDLDDPKIYATAGDPSAPVYTVISVGGESASDGPTQLGSHPLPGPGTRVVYDRSSQQVHVLGQVPGATGSDGPWTVYVIEPHGNAVYADARLPTTFRPVAWAADVEQTYPADDPQALLVFDGSGATAEIGIGSHAFAWRLPGVIAGALTAGVLFLLARILFRRRLVGALVALFVLVDGMFFVQARIGMNDAYVGLFIAAAYTLFAALWTGWLRGRLAFWLAMPVIGLLLGLALASKWVAAYAIGALLLLILVRSALGRVLAIVGLIGITGVLGYIAISVPEGAGFGNLTFLLIMIALTLVAVVVAIVHPIAWSDEEVRFAVVAPGALGAMAFFAALGLRQLNASLVLGSVAFTPLQLAIALALGSPAVAATFWAAARLGLGPLAQPPDLADPVRRLEPPATPPSGWLRPGAALGLPVVWVLACLVVLPLAVYIVSYLPWAMIGGHQIVPGWPPGHSGQTLLDLTGQMYRYHNDLADAHPASSPWWAWPFDLKPVWFYQEGLAAGTSASVYDTGNIVIWWLGVPAMAFVAFQAFKRRSLALALIAVGFAGQWIPWARIDRAAFQYHYYTSLPFVVLGLAYFVAELWHGASRRTWLLARVAGAVAILGPALMWTFSRPLCGFVSVLSVNPGSQACPALIPDFTVTARSGALGLVVGAGLIVIFLRFLEFDGRSLRASGRDATGVLGSLIGTGLAIVAALIIAALLPDTSLFTMTNVPVEPIAVVIGIPLAYLAFQVLGATDPRRFAVGIVVVAVGWFLVLYPNIAALPLPAQIVNAYQGILPTYLYAFQFPVSTVARGADTPLFTPTLALLLVALILTCLVVAYSARTWRLALAESTSSSGAPGDSDDTDGLVRSGGA